MKSPAACCLLVLLALPAAGLEPYLVKDVNPEPGPADSHPQELSTLGGIVLFSADDGISGRELWRSDGTSVGTWLLSDVCGGEGCSGNPVRYHATDRLYFFLAPGLWVSDGSPEGTFALTAPGVRVRPWKIWAAGQSILYFVAEDPDHGDELWRSDGTPAGTRLVADVRPGPQGTDIRWLAEHRGRIWFGADDGQRGGALWSTDGTAAGTVLAVDPVPSSPFHAAPEHIRAVGNRLTFFARTPGSRHSRQLWTGDGTPQRTVQATFLSGSRGATLYDSAARGNLLYFIAEDRKGQELWVSNGTPRGTRPLTSFPKRDAFFSDTHHLGFQRQEGLDGRFLFWANDGSHGSELWVTDGTPKGTRLLRDVCPGSCSSSGELWPAIGNLRYLSMAGSAHGHELWATDGTTAGTRLVRDICPGSCGSGPFAPFVVVDDLFFSAWDGPSGDGTGQEIWRTDGTAAGTVRVSGFGPEFAWTAFHGAAVNGQLLFAARDEDPHGLELWRTDGTAAGTRLVEDINRTDVGGSFPMGLRALGGEAVFAATSSGDRGLWRSDGTEAGTRLIRTFGPDEVDGGLPAGESAEAGGLLFYFGYDPALVRLFPWRTDGTEAGTFRLTGEGVCCVPLEMRAAGSRVFFQLQGELGRVLWTSDGTREGTRMVLDASAAGTAGTDPRELTAFQGKLYFAAESPAVGRELWVSDGTAAGTAPVLDLNPGLAASNPGFLTVHAGRLWFFAEDGERGRELWSSDGTAAGTALAVEIEPLDGSFEPRFMISLGDRLIVSGYSPSIGEGLWVTDGTAAGTRRIHERGVDVFNYPGIWTIFEGRLWYVALGAMWVTDGTEAGTGPLLDRDGKEIHSPLRFAALGDRLVFTAADVSGVYVLWESDGTPAGTFQILPPVRPGFELVRAGDRVFFPALDLSTGYELWAVRPDAP